MNNVVRCPKCQRWLIGEESDSHRCRCKIVDLKYKWCVRTKLDNIGEVVILEDKDGTLYRATPLPDDFLQGDGNSSNPTKNGQNLMADSVVFVS